MNREARIATGIVVSFLHTAAPHTLKVGDILFSSWGYDQTNISWYQVLAVKNHSVMIQEIAGKSAGGDQVLPNIGNFTGSPMLKMVRPGNSVRITSYAIASLWDGRPKYETPMGMGH